MRTIRESYGVLPGGEAQIWQWAGHITLGEREHILSFVLFLRGSLGKKNLATVSGRAGEPQDVLVSQSFRSCHILLQCLLVVLLQVFIGHSCQPISGRSPPVVVLSFSCRLFLFSSCSPRGVVLLSFWACLSFVLLVCWCWFLFLILLSAVVLLVFLLPCCLPC